MDHRTAPRLGTYTLSVTAAHAATVAALAAGVRAVDTAALYRNEAGVGTALSTVNRAAVRVTTKVHPRRHGAAAVASGVQASLAALGTPYVDVLLLHRPDPWRLSRGCDAKELRKETWRAMEAAVAQGSARSIGLSNVDAATLEDVLTWAAIPPTVVQVEFHPFNRPSAALLALCAERDIIVEGHSPFGGEGAPLLAHPSVRVACASASASASVATTLLAWMRGHGVAPVVRSGNAAHLAEAVAAPAHVDPAIASALDALHTGVSVLRRT